MDLALKGIVTGLILSIMVGPVFFVLLETSIRKGVKAAIALDIGVLLSDVIYIVIAFLFYKQVEDLKNGDDNSLLRLIGGGLFIIYGIMNFFKKVNAKEVKTNFSDSTTTSGYVLLILKGFVLNLMNPLVVFYWFSVMTMGANDKGSSESSIILFLTYILVTFFSIDLLKILGAKKLRPLVTQKVLMGLNRLVGIVFFVFGVILVAQGTLRLVTN